MRQTNPAAPLAAALLLALCAPALAQKSTADGIAEYREMLQDGNPAELFEMKGEELWKQKRGPKNASLERCDLGKGPGVVKGAFVELPRYFADTNKVQDLESRLLTCMQAQQGLDAAKIAATPFGKDEQKNMEGLVAWVSSQSKGMKLALPQSHAKEKQMYEVGKRMFYLRVGARASRQRNQPRCATHPASGTPASR